MVVGRSRLRTLILRLTSQSLFLDLAHNALTFGAGWHYFPEIQPLFRPLPEIGFCGDCRIGISLTHELHRERGRIFQNIHQRVLFAGFFPLDGHEP